MPRAPEGRRPCPGLPAARRVGDRPSRQFAASAGDRTPRPYWMTTTVPVIDEWIVQWYAYVPGAVNA